MPDSMHALWVDPLKFDVTENGPPYLPEKSARVRTAHSHTLGELLAPFEGKPGQELGLLVAVLRAASVVHQSHHWQTRGTSFYGDHLLFEKLYNDSLEAI